MARALKPGKHTLVFDFKYDGPGPGKGGTGVFTVDGKELASKTIEHSIPLMMTIDETLDIGVDTRTGVDDSYELPFKFTGTIDKLTFKLGPSQLAAADQKAAAEASPKPQTSYQPDTNPRGRRSARAALPFAPTAVKLLLKLIALIEVPTGLGLIAVPAPVTRLLLGRTKSPVPPFCSGAWLARPCSRWASPAGSRATTRRAVLREDWSLRC